MDLIWMIILLVFNFLIYGLCCFVINKRKIFTCISIRSPYLLILNILGNFFMSVIIIVTKYLKNDQKKICSFFYYITNFLIIIPFCLRFRRLAKCCEINPDQKLEFHDTNINRYKYEEKYSIKLMLIIFSILTAILIISNALITINEAITAKFLYEGGMIPILSDINSYIWLGINFIEHMVMLIYVYYICVNKLKQKLRFEIISCFIIWFLYSNLLSILEILPIELDNNVYVYISLAVCYLYLILNGILPIIISYSYQYSTSYSFNPKLMNDFYLFLSNELCYKKFKEFLIRKKQNLTALLKLYTGIMNFKLGCKLKLYNAQIVREGNEVIVEFFERNNKANLPENIYNKIQNDSKELSITNIKDEIFDPALKYCYTELRKAFSEFKNSDEFKKLYNNYYLDTYIQCKLCNYGLVNRFN